LLREVLGDMGLLCGGLRYVWWAGVLANSAELLSVATAGWGMVRMRKRGGYAKVGG